MESKAKIYVCGKMTGLENYNKDKFNTITKHIRNKGHKAFNPAEIAGNSNWKWIDYMKKAVRGMMSCDKVYVLKGFETSKGANIEIDLAKEIGMSVQYESEDYTKDIL